MNDWQPENENETRIVCAACKSPSGFMAIGPRHYDETMRSQIDVFNRSVNPVVNWEQGFIDQYGRFWNRKEAMNIVKSSGQEFCKVRNGRQDVELYSEGLY